MKKRTLIYANLITLVGLLYSCNSPIKIKSENASFGEIAVERSTIPLRPGEPGKAPFWNAYAKRFIYAPAFDFNRVEDAVKYKYNILSLKDSSTYRFESEVPYAPLSPVWASVPVGNFDLKVIAISGKGENLGIAGEDRFFKAAPFNGPYHEPVISYDSSAKLALDKVMYKDYVDYWLVHKSPDPGYWIYKYPAKVFGSVIVGAVMQARLHPGTDTATRAHELAHIVADYLLDISFPKGAPLAYFPPSYHGKRIGGNQTSHMQLTNYMMIAAAESGHAYLDLFDFTGEEKYLQAAKRIAQTYLDTQLENGTWYLYVNNQTGEPTAENLTIPTAIINYFDRLAKDYDMEGLEKATADAFNWIMKNPVETFDWQAQYEDVKAYAPYERLSREQVCDLAIYLFKHYKGRLEYIALAEDLIRFAEDQFITWEQMEDLVVYKGKTIRPAPDDVKVSPGWFSRTWMTPVVHEQYGFFMPSGRNTGLMIETYWYAYQSTQKKIYLAKALSIANNFTRVQEAHDGDYPTMFTKHPMNFWINNSIYPSKMMMKLAKDLEELTKEDSGFDSAYERVLDMLGE